MEKYDAKEKTCTVRIKRNLTRRFFYVKALQEIRVQQFFLGHTQLLQN